MKVNGERIPEREPNKAVEWMTEKQIAEMLGISRSTLQKMRFLRRGIPYTKIGRSVRYKKMDVERYMEEKKIVFA